MSARSADCRKVEPFGQDPRGIAIFNSADRSAIVISRSDLPKFASNDRMRGTVEENAAIVHGSFAFFGTYSVADGAIIQHIEGGTWSSWTGTDQKRAIMSFTTNEQTWTTVASFGGTNVLHWRRVK